MRRALVTFVIVVLAIAFGARAASAQTSADKATADTLFEAAKKAYDAGDYASACPKFDASNRLDRGVGVSLYLGDCWQHVGKIASAAKAFQGALELAQAQGDKRAAVAQRLFEKLRPSKLTIALATSAPGLVIEREGGGAKLTIAPGTELVDGGKYTITASAPGYERFTHEVDVPVEGGDVTVAIAMAKAREAAPKQAEQTPVADPRAGHGGAGLRVLGASLFAAGVAGVVVGSVLGVAATNDWNASNDPNVGKCDPTSEACRAQKGVDLRASANALGAGCTVALVAGSVLAASGATLFLLAPLTAKRSAGVWLAPTGLVLRGAF